MPNGNHNGKCIHIFHSEILRTSRTIFQRYHLGKFYLFAMQNPPILSIVGCVLKQEAVDRAF